MSEDWMLFCTGMRKLTIHRMATLLSHPIVFPRLGDAIHAQFDR